VDIISFSIADLKTFLVLLLREPSRLPIYSVQQSAIGNRKLAMA